LRNNKYFREKIKTELIILVLIFFNPKIGGKMFLHAL